MFLTDANLFLFLWEILDMLPEPERSKVTPPPGKTMEEVKEEVIQFLSEAEDRISIADFSLHSLGIMFFRLSLHSQFIALAHRLRDRVISLSPENFERLAEVSFQFNLDFDDAYQYVAAEKYNCEIVSFDSDFDRTDKGQLTPQQALERLMRKMK